MLFIPTLSKRQFESFVCSRYKKVSVVLPPDYAVASGTRYFGLRYVGLQDGNGDLSAAMLLFEYKHPGFPPFFYGCRAHILEHCEEAIRQEFIEALQDFAREYKAMFIFQAPDAETAIEPIVVRHIWCFLYEKVLPRYQRFSSDIKKLFKRNTTSTPVSFSVFDTPN